MQSRHCPGKAGQWPCFRCRWSRSCSNTDTDLAWLAAVVTAGPAAVVIRCPAVGLTQAAAAEKGAERTGAVARLPQRHAGVATPPVIGAVLPQIKKSDSLK